MDAHFRISEPTMRTFVSCSGDELLRANADDLELCEWAKSAKVGDKFETGGAQGECTVERTQ